MGGSGPRIHLECSQVMASRGGPPLFQPRPRLACARTNYDVLSLQCRGNLRLQWVSCRTIAKFTLKWFILHAIVRAALGREDQASSGS
mmetsp:Transcript_60808/g.125890  ORF Transcript_60808/g.125890 Transcript_60808/m.125890 type:complete len:88 (+) Transcript_60808:49-312(+)